ncbi:MAG: quinolinate synthase NadA [Hydrogenobacter thermophilus]|uniref:quinolinate synthase NadA n=1 Tax=Hydrogenobacter thermophilus TaxID=940 RepID=UPI000CBDC14C|nr:quinolinate synthase NadA [Hydrogenobacter thermophilus]QWK19475.1 MAG: quinolinate synthase NadA [Hydrogenobacter thermophilus]GBC88091.1 Quinolinate synthase A [bacterium HR13]
MFTLEVKKEEVLDKEELKALQEEVRKLAKEKNAVILAHYYQRPEVQDVADFIGDSLELSRKASQTDADIIVFCGVRFMCETAKIVNPTKKVLHPNPESGCPMADMISAKDVLRLKEEHPDGEVVAYVNTNAEVKAVSDVCVTSANAIRIVQKLQSKKIIFIPDQALGSWVKRHVPDKEFVIWQGFCPPHFEFTAREVQKLKEMYPDAKVAVHPECHPKVIDMADFVGSTSQIINYATTCDANRVIVITEVGLKYTLMRKNPNKEYIFPESMNYCGSVYCCTMKAITLPKVYETLKYELNQVTLPEEIIEKAKRPILRMLELS